MKEIGSLLTLLFLTIPGFAQEVEMADTMRSEGKIYVVVSIILTILGGLIFYLYTIDRKATRLEKKADEFSKK
ncbi:MAG: CcmD family protein [Cyclobacteriaceae bacterium]|nr:CcmD family protein [Cyclobacteriaceae bacterium]